MLLHETLAADPRLAPVFEEYLVCKVYLDQLEQDLKPETSTLRSAVAVRLKAIRRQLLNAASDRYPGLDTETIGKAAAVILERQPVGRAYYLAKLPA